MTYICTECNMVFDYSREANKHITDTGHKGLKKRREKDNMDYEFGHKNKVMK